MNRSASNMALPTDFLNKYGSWAVVTGASSGIGAEFAQQLGVAGFSLVLVARRIERLEATALTLREQYPIQVKSIEADLATDEGLQVVISETDDLDVGLFVSAAGAVESGSFFRTSREKHGQVTAVNVTAVTLLAHAFGLRMGRNRRGGIIFVSSMSAGGIPWSATYSSSKTYISTFASIVRHELRPRGVDVLCIEPGQTETEMIQFVQKDLDLDYFGVPWMTVAPCVRESLQSLYDGKHTATPGFLNKVVISFVRILPRRLVWFLLDVATKCIAKSDFLEFPDT